MFVFTNSSESRENQGSEMEVDVNKLEYSPPPSQKWSSQPTSPEKASDVDLTSGAGSNNPFGKSVEVNALLSGVNLTGSEGNTATFLELVEEKNVETTSWSPIEIKDGESREAKVGVTRVQTQKTYPGREESQSQISDSTCVCGPNPAPHTKRFSSQDTVVVHGIISRNLPLGTKARAGRKFKKVYSKFKKRDTDGEMLAKKNVACPSQASFCDFTSNDEAGVSKSWLVEDWLNMTVRPLLQNKNLSAQGIIDERLDPHLNWQMLKTDLRDSKTDLSFRVPREHTQSRAEIQSFDFEIRSDDESVRIMENDTNVRFLQKLLLYTKLKSLSRKLGKWSRKVRVGAKRESIDEEAGYGQAAFDKSWNLDYCPEIYYAAAANSEVGSVYTRIDNNLVCGSRRIASSSSLCFSETAPDFGGSDSSTGESMFDDSSIEFSNIRVILPCGEIGMPSKTGIFSHRKTPVKMSIPGSTELKASAAGLTSSISDKHSENSPVVTALVSEIADKIEEEEEVIEEVFTNKLDTDSFPKSKSAELQLFEVFKQYRETSFERKESQIAASESFTQRICQIFRASCEGSLALTQTLTDGEDCAHSDTHSNPPSKEENIVVLSSSSFLETLPHPFSPSSPEKKAKTVEDIKPLEGNDLDQPTAFGYCEEEVVNPFFGEVVTKCSQGFMKELKLAQKFFSKSEKIPKTSSPSEPPEKVSNIESKCESKPIEVAKSVARISEEKFDHRAQHEQFVAVVEGSAVSETTEDVSTTNFANSKTADSESESRIEISGETVASQNDLSASEEKTEIKAKAQSKEWWKFPAWPKAGNSTSVKTLWESLGLNKDSVSKKIVQDFADGEGLYMTLEARDKISFLPDLKNVIVEKANQPTESFGSGSNVAVKVSFSQETDTIIPVEINENLQIEIKEQASFDGILKQSSKLYPHEYFPDALCADQFEQPLDPQERKTMDEEMSACLEECERLICEKAGLWKSKHFEKACASLKGCWRLSLEFYINEAEEQILDYTYYFSQMGNTIVSILDSLTGLGEYYAILLDYASTTVTSRASLNEVEEKVKTLILSLKGSGFLLVCIEDELSKLAENPAYIAEMIEIAQKAIRSRQAITKIYRKFLKDHVNSEKDKLLAHKLTGYPIYYAQSKDFMSNEDLYETETFYNFGKELREALDIVAGVQTDLETRVSSLLVAVNKLKAEYGDNEENAQPHIDTEEKHSPQSSANVQNLGDDLGERNTFEAQEKNSIVTEEAVDSKTTFPKKSDPSSRVMEALPVETKKFAIPGWMKFQQFGKRPAPA